jgi:hypothetical protein
METNDNQEDIERRIEEVLAHQNLAKAPPFPRQLKIYFGISIIEIIARFIPVFYSDRILSSLLNAVISALIGGFFLYKLYARKRWTYNLVKAFTYIAVVIAPIALLVVFLRDLSHDNGFPTYELFAFIYVSIFVVVNAYLLLCRPTKSYVDQYFK